MGYLGEVWRQALEQLMCGAPSAGTEQWQGGLATSLSGALASGRLLWALGVALLGGMLTALTPCVYPVIPITVRYFGALPQGRRGRRAVWPLALSYVGGMVVLYASLGTLFAATHQLFGALLAQGWLHGVMALFCAAMGLSMLGLFTLQLPLAWQARLNRVGGQSLTGAALMGLVSGLIAAPCTGPVLAVILAVVAVSGQVALGGLLMLAFALGLGLPMLLLALFSGALQRLPASGGWMEAVKAILAAAMFVVALYFGHHAWPAMRQVLASGAAHQSAVWALALGTLLLGWAVLRPRARAVALAKSAAAVLLAWGVAAGMVFAPAVSVATAAAPPIAWQTEHTAAVAAAQAARRPMLIDFTAAWCQACHELDEKSFSDERVRREAQRFVAVKLDATELDAAMEAIFATYGVLGLPTVLFVDSAGRRLAQPRVTGFVSADTLLQMMQSVP